MISTLFQSFWLSYFISIELRLVIQIKNLPTNFFSHKKEKKKRLRWFQKKLFYFYSIWCIIKNKQRNQLTLPTERFKILHLLENNIKMEHILNITDGLH